MGASSLARGAVRAWHRCKAALARVPYPGLAKAAGVLGGVLATGTGRAVTLPEDAAEAMLHVYKGGGLTASGPALLVRKSMADKVSLSASYYVDAVSSASVDVVTTASPYKETRKELGLGADYVVRDSKITLSAASSTEPDYEVSTGGIDVSQETFGGMTTVTLGYTHSSDKVGRKGSPGFFDSATHWQYRLGVTQILTPRWIMSANFEAIADDGFLASPYRVARVFGAAVPERLPRTRSSRAISLGTVADLGARDAVHGQYRYFWDNWDIRAHTVEAGYRRYLRDRWLGDATLRLHTQDKALFYSDNATAETRYVTRNRQFSTFRSVGLAARLSYDWKREPGRYEVKAHGSWEVVNFRYTDYTDLRTGSAYSFNANVLRLYLTATY